MNYKTLIALTLTGLLLVTGSASAAEYNYPHKNPVLSVTFPDDWTVEADPSDEKGLIATTADTEIEINFWVLDGKALKADAATTLEETAVEVADLINQWVTDFKADKPQTGELNGISFYEIAGSGQDKENGEAVKVTVSFLTPDNKNIFVFMYWGSEEAEKTYAEQLEGIVKSLKKP